MTTIGSVDVRCPSCGRVVAVPVVGRGPAIGEDRRIVVTLGIDGAALAEHVRLFHRPAEPLPLVA